MACKPPPRLFPKERDMDDEYHRIPRDVEMEEWHAGMDACIRLQTRGFVLSPDVTEGEINTEELWSGFLLYFDGGEEASLGLP